MSDTERDGSPQSCVEHIIHRDVDLKCLKTRLVQELNEANRHAFITPDLCRSNEQLLVTQPVYYKNLEA